MTGEDTTKTPTSPKIYVKPVVDKGPTLGSVTAGSSSGGVDATGSGSGGVFATAVGDNSPVIGAP